MNTIENSYNIIVGVPWVNTFNPNGNVYFNRGFTGEEELYFLVDSQGKTDQEILDMLKMNGDIYLTGNISFINSRGKINIKNAHLKQ